MPIPSEISIISDYSIFITHTNIHLKNLWIIFTLFFKNKSNSHCHCWALIVYLMANHHLSQICSSWNVLFYLNFLPLLIALISFLTPSQTSVYFVNTFLFLPVEPKTEYLFPLLSLINPSVLSITRYKRFTR